MDLEANPLFNEIYVISITSYYFSLRTLTQRLHMISSLDMAKRRQREHRLPSICLVFNVVSPVVLGLRVIEET